MPMTHASTAHRVAAEVRAVLARQGKPRRLIGEALGLSQPAVSRRLSGEIPFDVNELTVIADLLEVPLSALLPAEPAAVSA